MQIHKAKTPNLAVIKTIPEGKAGIVETLKIMRKIVRKQKSALPVRNKAIEITSDISNKDWAGEIKAVQSWVKNNVKYRKDIMDVETLHLPETLLDVKSGDCDDHSLLVASLLESIGHPTRFVAMGYAPNDYVHVNTETRIGNKWVSVETTEPVDIGWKPDNIVSRLVIHN